METESCAGGSLVFLLDLSAPIYIQDSPSKLLTKDHASSLRHEAAHLKRTATAKQPKSQMDRTHHGLEAKSAPKENRNKTRLNEVRGQEAASLV